MQKDRMAVFLSFCRNIRELEMINKIQKKWIVMIFFLLSIIKMPAYGEELPYDGEEQNVEADTELIFDADVVKNKTAAKSALADMHGVFVFRSAFITQEAIVKETEKENREIIENTVLTSEQPVFDYNKWVDMVLTSESEKYIKDVYIEEKENSIFLWIFCIILSVCFLCVAIIIEDTLKKRKTPEEKKNVYESI